MSNAHIAPDGLTVGVNETMRVSRGNERTSVGSCNACTPQTQEATYQTVTLVELRGLQLRLCPCCAASLKAQL